MIKYSLACERDHFFESWFDDSASFERQSESGLVACPTCESPRVRKALMAPAVIGAKKRDAAPNPPAETGSANVALMDDRHRRLRELASQVRQEIFAKTNDVGRQFPEEARAIHTGEAPFRSIRGQATSAEARELTFP